VNGKYLAARNILGQGEKAMSDTSTAEGKDAQTAVKVILLAKDFHRLATAYIDDKKTGCDYQSSYERYLMYKKHALDLASDIADDYYFGAAAHKIINSLVAAEEMQDAQKLFKKVKNEMIREAILDDCPQLKKRWFNW